MKKKLYVGNLSFETTESELQELFCQAGSVETVRIITDRPINIGETLGYSRSQEYDLTLLELHLGSDRKSNSGSLVIGGRFKIDKKKNQIYFETYRNAPWRLANVMER
jgi:RNA recognition motif-containing protein